MKGFVETLLEAEASCLLFLSGARRFSASDVRAMAGQAAAWMADRDGPVFLHTRSAARFAAGVLAAAATNKVLALPAHTQPAYLAEVGASQSVLLGDGVFDRLSESAPLQGAQPDPLLIFFTSGSTGVPKTVEKSLSRLETEARALEDVWGRHAGHTLGTVSHQHIYGLLYRLMWPVMFGRTSDDEAATYWEDIAGRLSGATLISSPAHLTRLPPHAFEAKPALTFSSGQLLPTETAVACAAAFGAPPFEVLGSTETGGIGWRQQTEADTPWTPFAQIEIVTDAEGALSVRSPYLQTPEAHATGDNAVLLEDGRFRLQPRGDRVVKVDGKRVSLTRVEETLGALPDIDAAAALTLPTRKDALGAVAVLSEQGRARLDADGAFRLSRHLRAAASDALEPAERPKHWRFVDAIPVDAQGKRTQSALRALFESDNMNATSPLDVLDLDVRAHSDTEAEIAFTLAPELIFFEGHFPERQILPGVAQAHLAVLIAERLWGDWPSDANIARLKFRRVLTPNEFVVLKLKRDADIGRVTFSYALDGEVIAQGEVGGFAAKT